MQRPRVSVIVVTWNSADVLDRCLDSLEAQQVAGGSEAIVVDNASTDATAELLDRRAGRVRAIRNEENRGYGGANDQGAEAAEGAILLFLNPDTELLGPDALERLAGAAEAPGVGIAGPMLVNPDGTLQSSCGADQTVTRALLLMSGLHRLLPDRLRARVVTDRWSHSEARDVDWLLGAALAIPADVFRAVGGFWPVTYGEEQDLARRVRARGLRVRFEPAARVMHVGNHAFGQRWSNPERAALGARAEVAFLRAHYDPVRGSAIRAIHGAGYAARVVCHRAVGNRERAAVFRAMARVLAGR